MNPIITNAIWSPSGSFNQFQLSPTYSESGEIDGVNVLAITYGAIGGLDMTDLDDAINSHVRYHIHARQQHLLHMHDLLEGKGTAQCKVVEASHDYQVTHKSIVKYTEEINTVQEYRKLIHEGKDLTFSIMLQPNK